MKKIKIYTLIVLAFATASSCKKDFLEDIRSYDKYDESIFENEVLTGWYIDRLYYDFFAAYKSPILSVTGLYNDIRSRSTEEIGGTVTDYINPTKTLMDASQADDYFGKPLTVNPQNHPYTRIRNANFLIEKIADRGDKLSSDFKRKARGQMYFLRALQYFDLVRVYGGVPLITTVENATNTNPDIQRPRATAAETFALIVSDLDSAVALLPMQWDDGSNYGRFTAASALALKSKALLTFASPLFNKDWNNASNSRWQTALTASLDAEAKLTAAGYGLYGSSAKDWAEMWYKNDNKFNKEALMVQLLSNKALSSGINSNGWERSIRLNKQTGAGGIIAPKEMIDLFPMADGSRPVAGVNYDSTLFFMDRDPRFYRTFAFSGMKWPVKEASVQDVVWLYRWRYNTSSYAYSDGNNIQSAAVVKKMTNPPGASTVDGLAYSGTEIFEYRYAELLLNIAECYAAKGDIANANVYIGKVRQRVGIPAANNYGVGTLASKSAAIDAVLYERRVELAYEGKRFWDLQRWMLYNDDASADNNTNAILGIPTVNGTTRSARLWQYKTTAPNATDPLLAARGSISIDPDAANFAAQLNALKTFYQNNLITLPADQALDRVNNVPVTIQFRQNYYISGLHSSVLSLNPWLQQTIGWNDYNGSPGTFNWRN